MNQITLDIELPHKKTCKEVFLGEINKVVSYPALVKLIQPHVRGAHQAVWVHPPFGVKTMRRIHCLQLWWNLSAPEMHQTKKGHQWHHGMKLYIGEETEMWGDAGYRCLDKREEFQGKKVRLNSAMRRGKRRAMTPFRELHQLLEKAGKLKASIRAKMEHPFRWIKRQFGYTKVRYRGLKKNTQRRTMLCALGNVRMVRRQLLVCRDECACGERNGCASP